ncbi:MAG: hypothetical protein AAF726_11985 [Planctomycetota bacterium]
MQPTRALKGLLIAATGCLALACSSGGGGDDGGNNGGGGPARAFSIEDTAATGMGTDLLVQGDAFIGEPDLATAEAIGDRIWAVLTSTQTWIAPNPLYSYQFYVDSDPITNWGRAFRYTGFNVEAGPISIPQTAGGFYGTGTYVAADGQQFDAVILRTWDTVYWELLVIDSPTTFVHSIQNVNGLPLPNGYVAQ